MNVKVKFFSFLLVISYLNGCTYQNEEELYPKTKECISGEMSYAKDILPILTNFGCNSCHTTQSSIQLETHSQVLVYVNNKLLVESIEHINGARPMPEGSGKMDQCSIDKIKKWIEEGAKNN